MTGDGRWQRRRQWTVSSSCPTSATITFLCRESSGAVFLLSGNYISHFSKTLFLHRSKPHLQRACCPELSLLKYIWSRVNCWERIVFDVVCKLSPLDHISPSGTLDITRPPAGRQQLFTLFPFLLLLFAYFDIKCQTKCFFEKSNGWKRWI